MKLKMFHVDALTDTLFQGNPEAVVPLTEWLSEFQMQQIAAENNLAETAFIKQVAGNKYHIRWFTPTIEVPFCGHATLASAFVLFKENDSLTEVVFTTEQVGELIIYKGDNGFIQMDFPNRKPTEVIDNPPQELLAGLSIKPQRVVRNVQAYFAIYENEQQVRDVVVNSEQLAQLDPYCVTVTAPGQEYDFVSRFFATNHGVDEDPVTGSIHTGLAPYWAEQLNKTRLSAYQASARGGKLLCEVKGDRVVIEGKAVLYLEGLFYLPD